MDYSAMDISSRSDESHEEDSHGEDSRDSDSGSAETADRPPTTRPSPCRKATGRKKKQPSSVLLVKKLRRLHIRIEKLKTLHGGGIPVLLLYKKGKNIQFVGNTDLVNTFKSDKQVKVLINNAFLGNTAPATKAENYVDRDVVKTLLEKGSKSVLKQHLILLIANYATGGKRVKNFWGPVNEHIFKPSWWPPDVPFSSPNMRERDATIDKPVLTPEQVDVLGEALRNEMLQKGFMEHLLAGSEAEAENPIQEQLSQVEGAASSHGHERDQHQQEQAINSDTDLFCESSLGESEPIQEQQLSYVEGSASSHEHELDQHQPIQEQLSHVEGAASSHGQELDQHQKEPEVNSDNDLFCDSSLGGSGSIEEQSNLEGAAFASGHAFDQHQPSPDRDQSDAPLWQSTPLGDETCRKRHGSTDHVETPQGPLENRHITMLQRDAQNATISPNVIPREHVLQLASLAEAELGKLVVEDWLKFKASVANVDPEIRDRCKAVVLANDREFSMRELPKKEVVIDQSYVDHPCIPNGMFPLQVESSHDNLFTAIGKLMFGTASVTPILRLLTVVEAVEHSVHFVKELRGRYITIDDAVEFLFAATSEEVFLSRPSLRRTTAENVLRYMTRREVMALVDDREHTGFLQVRFLATVLSKSINCHCFSAEVCHGGMLPCKCQTTEGSPLNLLFISPDKNYFPSLFIPLVWKIGDRSRHYSLPEQKLAKLCAGTKRLGSFATASEREKWVTCGSCSLPYHAVCSGLVAPTSSFACCMSQSAREELFEDPRVIFKYFPQNSIIFQWCPKVIGQKKLEKQSITTFELFTVHSFGITSSVVQFFAWLMQTDVIQSSKTFIASAEESYAILTAKNAAGRNVTTVVAHKELTTKNDVIMFPCNIRSGWRWVLIVFSLAEGWVCVFDPIPSEDGHETICGQLMEFIHNQQKIEGEQETVFTPMGAQITEIDDHIDCGLFMLHIIECLLRKDYEVYEGNKILVNGSNDVNRNMRRRLLQYIYAKTRDTKHA